MENSYRACILSSQGSNLALANLLNASSFLQKASKNCHYLLFLASGNHPLSYQPYYATQHKLHGKQRRFMANSVDPDQPASDEAG